MLDTDPVPAANGTEPPRSSQFRTVVRLAFRQPGNSATAGGHVCFFLSGQFFVLDGGMASRGTAGNLHYPHYGKPAFNPTAGEPCRFLEKIDAMGSRYVISCRSQIIPTTLVRCLLRFLLIREKQAWGGDRYRRQRGF